MLPAIMGVNAGFLAAQSESKPLYRLSDATHPCSDAASEELMIRLASNIGEAPPCTTKWIQVIKAGKKRRYETD